MADKSLSERLREVLEPWNDNGVYEVPGPLIAEAADAIEGLEQHALDGAEVVAKIQGILNGYMGRAT